MVQESLPWHTLITRLEQGFSEETNYHVPVRHHHTMVDPVGQLADSTLLLMPAWKIGAHVGLKAVNVFPSNCEKQLPAINGSYLLMSGTTGQALAVIDGNELTARRTATASVLAAKYLASARP